MKHPIIHFLACVLLLLPVSSLARQQGNKHLSAALAIQTARALGTNLTQPDAYGTPYILKLARQGDITALRQATQHVSNGDFLLAKDRYGNNIFHVAKDATMVQKLASLVRQFYGDQTPQIVRTLVDAENRQGETPLMTQINAGHADTFRLLYPYTTLRVKNNAVKDQLARLHGVDETIQRQNRAMYCANIVRLSSANGRTLLQAAQGQIPYNPAMTHLVQELRNRIPCLNEI